MVLLQAWKESLIIFLPKNFKLFLLVTLKSIGQAYTTLFTDAGLFLLLGLASYLYSFMIIPILVVLIMSRIPSLQIHITRFWIATALVSVGIIAGLWVADMAIMRLYGPLFSEAMEYLEYFLLKIQLGYTPFIMYLAVRPSVFKKNHSYFARYHRFFFPIVLSLLFLELLLDFSSCFGRAVQVVVGSCDAIIIFSPLILFFVLFFLDTGGDLKSLLGRLWSSALRAVKMVFYNIPFCLVVSLVYFFAQDFIVSMIDSNLDQYPLVENISSVVVKLLYPIPLCFMANYYIKKVHEQLTVYFGNNG